EEQNAAVLEQLKAKNAESLERLSAALELHKGKLASAHADKLTLYRSIVDLLVEIVMVREFVKAGQPQDPAAWARFEIARLKAHGHLAIFAPQAVLDAYADLVDFFLDVADGKAAYDFRHVRDLGFAMFNRVREDLGIDPSPVTYRGRR